MTKDKLQTRRLSQVLPPRFLRGRIIVLIDAANLEVSVKDLGWHIDYRQLHRLFNQRALVAIRYYCVRHSVANQDKFFTFLKKAGYHLITKPLKIITSADRHTGDIRKANFDVEIALDACQLLPLYDTLVLFSGDSDFDYLLQRLRTSGKRTVVISTRYHISRELIMSSDKYVDLKKLKTFIERDYVKRNGRKK